MTPAYLHGLGLWTPGYASPEAWCRGEPDPEIVRAEARMLDGPLRRRASPLTRISVDAFEQATRAAGVDPVSIPTIWATAHGEHATAIKLLKMMLRGEGKLSPTHFHNSVHNTPSAYASISGGNASPSTTLTGGPELVACSIIEALCHLEGGATEIAVILADEPLQDPFVQPRMEAPLAIGFCFSSESAGAIARLTDLRREILPAVKPHDRLGGLYVSAGLSLLEHAVARRPGTISFEVEEHWRRDGTTQVPVWCGDLEPL